MTQLFICSTPYHVLLSHLTVELLCKEETCNNTRILILTESAIGNEIHQIIDQLIWNQILILPFQKSLNLYKTKQFIDNWINDNGLRILTGNKEVIINDDKRWRNQLLITGVKPDRISLIEDGMGAYIRGSYPLRDRIYRGFILKTIFRNRLINTGNISSIHADRFFAFRDSAYSWFGPNRKLYLLEYKNSSYIKKIGQRPFIKKQRDKFDSSKLIILTSPIVEDYYLSINEELRAWSNLSLYLQPDTEKIIVKSHPREDKILSEQRLTILSKVFKHSQLIKVDGILPAEFLLCDEDIEVDVFSPNSTILANLKSIRPELKIYHGYDLFFSKRKTKSAIKNTARYLNQLGVPSISMQ